MYLLSATRIVTDFRGPSSDCSMRPCSFFDSIFAARVLLGVLVEKFGRSPPDRSDLENFNALPGNTEPKIQLRANMWGGPTLLHEGIHCSTCSRDFSHVVASFPATPHISSLRRAQPWRSISSHKHHLLNFD